MSSSSFACRRVSMTVMGAIALVGMIAVLVVSDAGASQTATAR
jgi:hypothetical protein